MPLVNTDDKKGSVMKAEDFNRIILWNGKYQYEHIRNGEIREQMIKDVKSNKMSIDEFKAEQKKMLGGKYLKCLYSETEYLKAIGNL